MDKKVEEYEPNQSVTGSTYVPSYDYTGCNQTGSAVEEYNPDDTSGDDGPGYKPSLEYIQPPVTIKTMTATHTGAKGTMGDSGNQSGTDSDSDTDSDPEFTPIPENLKKRNNFTDEEKNNYQVTPSLIHPYLL
jgi:hypothetical protein